MSVKITWQDANQPGFKPEGFLVYRSETPISLDTLPAALGSLPASAASYTDDTVLEGVTYYYRIAAWLGARISVSEQVQLTATVDGGGSALPKKYRYWQINFTDQHGDYSGRISTSEIQLRAAAGGADETSPADASTKASAKSHFPGNTPNRAFDDSHSPGTWWTSGGSVYAGTGEWIRWDFGAGREIAVVEITIRAIHTQLGLCPEAFTVQSSDDSIIWNDIWSVAAIPSWSANERRVYTKP